MHFRESHDSLEVGSFKARPSVTERGRVAAFVAAFKAPERLEFLLLFALNTLNFTDQHGFVLAFCLLNRLSKFLLQVLFLFFWNYFSFLCHLAINHNQESKVLKDV